MRLKLIGMLVLVAAGLAGMVYALTQGDLWAAGLLAFNGAVLLIAYRTEKQLQRRP
jgi:glucose-6-phosphate-specific signal transduction histidine kinase